MRSTFSMTLLTPMYWWFLAMYFTTLPPDVSNSRKFWNKSIKR